MNSYLLAGGACVGLGRRHDEPADLVVGARVTASAIAGAPHNAFIKN